MAFDSDLYGSGTPARVLCRDPASGRWEDVHATVLARLQHAVARGSGVARAPLPGGRWHVCDFARMLRFDEADPAARPVALAWIDEGGNHFFPPGTTTGAEIEPSARCEVGDDEAVAVVRTWTFDGAVLTGARRCVPTSAMLKQFAEREQELGNVKLGWYGGTPADVRTAAGADFSLNPNWMLLGEDRAHGRGLHLAPLRFPHLSMSIAEADDKGKAQILLCRIVQGQPAVRAGSDWSGLGRSVGGVDYLSNPSWYIIWNEHINSCIMPLCIVSFTKHPMIQDLGPMPVPFPLKVDMQKLCKEFKRFLPISKLQTLDDYYNSNMGNSYNFSKAVCELVGAAMFVGAILKSLEH